MEANLSKKIKDGFTLVELLAVIVVLGLTITIGFNTINRAVNNSKEKAYKEQVDRIIKLAKTWSVTNTDKLPEKNETVYVTLQNLRDEQLLNGTVINPIDNTEMNGCVRVTNRKSNDTSEYKYLEIDDCPNFSMIYNLEYELNGGILEKENPKTYTVRTKTFTLNNPTKNGSYFIGWVLDGETESRETVRIYRGTTGDKKFTALWGVASQILTINPNGGIYEGSSEIISYTKAVGATVEIKMPEREGYIFTGWTVEAESGQLNDEQDLFTIGPSDATLTANWTISCTDKPVYTYTGEESGVIDDGDGNWRIKFLTSGTFTLASSVCGVDAIDVFMVGGGSSGGGSGYTQTYKKIEIEPGKPYEIVVGEGGAPGSDGTASKAFGYSAEPGSGCDGGSGCGSNGYTHPGAAGGSDGSNGKNSTYDGGTGQGRTTREFSETIGKIYAGGGGGGTGWCHGNCDKDKTGCNINDVCYNGGFDGGIGGVGGGGNGTSKDASCTDGEANTGGGAGTGVRGAAECSGGSGIVIIRKAIDLGLEYTYTGESELLEDGNGIWRLRLLTDGNLVFNRLTTDIDAFLVGGGGGAENSTYPSTGAGGGGGYAQTIAVKPEIGKEYEITIGSGGTPGNNGGATKAFGYRVLGGSPGYAGVGGNGGSGGGGHTANGGSDGSDGTGNGGMGQGSSTREFGEANGTLYAGGGGGHTGTAGLGTGKENTGGGGSAYSGSGYSGVVVIRKHKENVLDVKYTYTGDSVFIDDGDGNWRIKFLNSGTFTPQEDMEIDVFLVGGGGGAENSSYPSTGAGGGGGETSTNTTTLTANTEYSIVIGSGGAAGEAGESTTGFTFSASGGSPGYAGVGGNGGSGGGGHVANGGSDGSDGTGNGGTGQGSSTREFGEANGTLYAGGGGGWTGTAGLGTGKENTGGGGSAYSGSGYSGIVIIRNTR